MTKFLAALVVALPLLLTFGAASVSAQVYDVGTVVVEGNQAVESALITSVSGLTPGSKLSSTSIQEAIRRIYGLSLFSDVKIDGEFAGGKVNIRVTVAEFPRVKTVRFEGHRSLKEKDFKAKISVAEGQTVSPNQIATSIDAIRKLYREDGFFLARIEVDQQVQDSNSVSLTFKIDENQKVRVREIDFFGNEQFSDGKLRGQMKTKPGGFLRSGTLKKDQYEQDKEKVLEFYRQRGYIDAAVVSDSFVVDLDGKRMAVHITVNEGIRYHFGPVTFKGNELFSSEALARRLKFKTGDVYNSDKFEESVTELYGAYQEDGYIHVRVIDNIQTLDSTLNIEFEVSEGVPAHINKILIEGNTKTKEKVIRRELFSRPGQIFQRSLLMRSLRNVMLLNYFTNVEPDIRNLPNGDVDMVLKVEEKPTGQIQAGAGYSGQDKLVGTLGLGIPNFRGEGQNVNLDWSFGSRRSSISLSFTEPWMLDTPTLFGLDVFRVNRLTRFTYDPDPDDGSSSLTNEGELTETSRGGGIRLGRRLTWPDDYFRVSLRYSLEDSRISEVESAYRALYPNGNDPLNIVGAENRWRRQSTGGFTITRDSRDLSQFATSGSLHQLTTEASIGGDWDYHKMLYDVSYYKTVWWKFVLAAKMRVGVVSSPRGDAGIPPLEKFAPGGTNNVDGTIRGYDDQSVLVPITVSNRRFDVPDTDVPSNYDLGLRSGFGRGRAELIYNLELQVPIVPQQIYALAFADAGNAFASTRGIKFFDLSRDNGLKKSVGFGVRLAIPGIGTIGFDFGYGYNNPEGAGWKPHFQVGTTF